MRAPTSDTAPESPGSKLNSLMALMVDALPQLVWSTRPDGFCDYYNRRWLDYTGATYEEHAGSGWQVALHPEDAERVAAAWVGAVTAREPYRVEYRLRRYDGVYRWFLANGLPIEDEQGEIVRWFGTCTDIDDQKREQERQRFLAELADHTRVLTSPAELMQVTVRLLGQFLGVNRASFNEIDADSSTSRVLSEYATEDSYFTGTFSLSDFGDEFARNLMEGWVVAVDDTATHPVAREHHSRTYQPLGIGSFLSVPLVRDRRVTIVLMVNDRKPRVWTTEEADLILAVLRRTWLSLENARLNEELEEHQRRMADLLATVPGVVWESSGNPADGALHLDFISEYAEKLLGYTTAEWLATPDFWRHVVHPDDQERAEQESSQQIAGETDRVSEARWLTREGGVRWVSSHSVTVRGDDGTPVGLRGVTLDITERKKAEQEILLLNERLRRAMQETHHRVRNSLQLVAALLDRYAQSEKGASREQLRDVGGQILALAAVHDLLTDQAKRDSTATDISARDFLLKLVQLVKDSTGTKWLMADIADARLTAREATSLAIVANELLSNAIKYGNGEVSVTFDVDGDCGHLTVTDNGPGFPEGFRAADTASGLGLASHIASWDLQAHDFRFETLPDAGGRVSLTLPLSLTPSPTPATGGHNGGYDG